MSSTTKSPLRALIDILSSSVDALESAYAFKGASIQSLDELYTPNPELELDPHITETTNLIVGAAHQLIASVSLPMTTLASSFAMAMYNASALQYAVETSIADVLKEGDPEGLHVDEIAAKIKSKESDKTGQRPILLPPPNSIPSRYNPLTCFLYVSQQHESSDILLLAIVSEKLRRTYSRTTGYRLR
jgi:hypothetical protein